MLESIRFSVKSGRKYRFINTGSSTFGGIITTDKNDTSGATIQDLCAELGSGTTIDITITANSQIVRLYSNNPGAISIEDLDAELNATNKKIEDANTEIASLKKADAQIYNSIDSPVNGGFNFIDFTSVTDHRIKITNTGTSTFGGLVTTSAKIVSADNVIQTLFNELGAGTTIVVTIASYAQYVRFYSNAIGSILIEDLDAKLYEIEQYVNNIENPKVFYVGSTRTYTTIKSGVAEAIKYKKSVVYIDAGTYDLLVEFADGIAALEAGGTVFCGVKMENQVHIIFSSGAKVKADYIGTNLNVGTYFAPFYIGNEGDLKGFTLENLNLTAGNTRYAVHDEGGFIAGECISRYINCHIVKTNSRGGEPSYTQCIGGGTAQFHYIEMRNCYFRNPTTGAIESNPPLASYHNNGLYANTKSYIVVSNCYFADNGTFGIYSNGVTTQISDSFVNNNSFGSEPIVSAGDNLNVSMTEFMNERRWMV